MNSRAEISPDMLPARMGLSKITLGIALGFLVLVLSFGLAAGYPPDPATESSRDAARSDEIEVVENESTEEDAEVESVTMSISLEKGGVIDLKPLPRDVTIETWKGKDVLVIVEKTKRASQKSESRPALEPINIEVTRNGKDVLIETWGGAGWDQCGMDLSFRIMLPLGQHIEPGSFPQKQNMSRVRSVLWRKLHLEAIRWLLF